MYPPRSLCATAGLSLDPDPPDPELPELLELTASSSWGLGAGAGAAAGAAAPQPAARGGSAAKRPSRKASRKAREKRAASQSSAALAPQADVTPTRSPTARPARSPTDGGEPPSRRDSEAQKKKDAVSGAPHLREYFSLLAADAEQQMGTTTNEIVDRVMQELGGINDVAMAVEVQRRRERAEKELHAKLVPLVHKCFDRHDINGDKRLTPDESRLFFRHYCSELTRSLSKTLKFQLKKRYDAQLERARGWMRVKTQVMTPAGQLATITKSEKSGEIQGNAQQGGEGAVGKPKSPINKAKLREAVQKEVEKAEVLIEEMRVAYLDNAEKRNEHAFTVLDVNGDGCLVLAEVMLALAGTPEQRDALADALGLNADTVEIATKAKAEVDKDDDGGAEVRETCSVQ